MVVFMADLTDSAVLDTTLSLVASAAFAELAGGCASACDSEGAPWISAALSECIAFSTSSGAVACRCEMGVSCFLASSLAHLRCDTMDCACCDNRRRAGAKEVNVRGLEMKELEGEESRRNALRRKDILEDGQSMSQASGNGMYIHLEWKISKSILKYRR